MEIFADIIVSIHNLPLEHPFTYLVPAKIKLVVGSRVLVPFGNRKLVGYCVRLHRELPGESKGKIKEIIRALDEEPLLTAELVALATWGAQRYLCQRIKFLEAMVPSSGRTTKGLRAKKTKTAVLLAAGQAAKATGKKQQLALQLLSRQGALALTQLADAGVGAATVRSLEKKGWLEIKEQIVRRDPLADTAVEAQTALSLTNAQREALAYINQSEELKPVLLFGVTGSGKTEVYLRAIAQRLSAGLASIVLVPEIALTPQMTERFVSRFGDRVAVLHSRLGIGERYDEWCRIARGEALVIIGARSAVFAPVKKLGLIILDEEHETTYKQEESPRYHARELALWRAQWHGAKVILGSATPSLESYHAAEGGNYQLLRLPERIAQRPLPPVEVVDMREELKDGHKSIFSRPLITALQETVAAGKQIILFLNRRGYATFVLCRECGHVMRCPACNVALKYHAAATTLRCHYCDHHEPYPNTCPVCSGRYIRHFGTGTQKVEAELLKQFPDYRVLRLDADTTTHKGDHQKILTAFKQQKADVLVGTQMIAKGLDFPNVTLVGVITADTAINLPDFRAGERTFQLLTQVAGRAGRGAAGGKVVVQTYTPEHYAIVAAKTHDYESFYAEESQARAALGYPPYGFLLRLLVSGQQEGAVVDSCSFLVSTFAEDIELLGPSPCPIEKVRNRFRWQLVVRGDSLEPLLAAAKKAAAAFLETPLAGSVRLALDVEPQSLL
ncbi:MAG TPA: primosomal protein N' [Oscillospiraceae bacterium]|nr:primosomal protein N' [Oscillospiraceae bacterium]